MKIINIKNLTAALIISFIFLSGDFALPAFASTTDSTIDSVSRYAWSENAGWIDFGTAQGNVHITDTALTGYAYGENLGWISLNCSNDDTCDTGVNYRVANEGNGILSGWAWSENAGWIDFSPTQGGVIVNSSGEFSGYAYGENIGWIVFNCGTTDSCGDVNYKVATGLQAEATIAENAKIESWKATLYAKPDTSCVQRLKLNIQGKYFDKNAEVAIGSKKAFSTDRKSSKEITAKFCLAKLLNIKTDLQRAVSVTNPDADRKKAKKKIDLANLLAVNDFDMQTVQGIKNIQTALVKLGLLDQRYITGFYGPITTAAVRKFQERSGLPQTGIVDATTKGKLGA